MSSRAKPRDSTGAIIQKGKHTAGWTKASAEALAHGIDKDRQEDEEEQARNKRYIELFLKNHREKQLTGRPTTYKPEEHDQVLLEGALKGKSVASIATEMGIHRDTLYHWREVHPTFADLFSQARQLMLRFYEDRLNNYSIYTTGSDQKRLEMGAINLILKSWFREEYQDQPQVIIANTADTSKLSENIKDKLNDLELKIRNGHNK